jgi:hypothetical protein
MSYTEDGLAAIQPLVDRWNREAELELAVTKKRRADSTMGELAVIAHQKKLVSLEPKLLINIVEAETEIKWLDEYINDYPVNIKILDQSKKSNDNAVGLAGIGFTLTGDAALCKTDNEKYYQKLLDWHTQHKVFSDKDYFFFIVNKNTKKSSVVSLRQIPRDRFTYSTSNAQMQINFKDIPPIILPDAVTSKKLVELLNSYQNGRARVATNKAVILNTLLSQMP